MSIGLWGSFFAAKHHYVPKQFILLAAIGVIALLYYLLFFLTLVSPTVGKITAAFIYLIGWAMALYGLTRVKSLLKNRTVAYILFLPLTIMLVLLGYYTVLLTSCRVPTNGLRSDNSSFCAIHSLPVDNALPYLYANNLVSHKPHALIGDWNLVDRPPIQIGAGLGILDLSNRPHGNYEAYQLVGTFLQLSWVAALFGFFITVRLKPSQVVLALGIVSMSGFIFVNSIFVWPKFFAGSLVLAGCLLLLDTGNKHYRRTLITAAALLSLGLLIHDSVAFTIAAVGLVLIYRWLRTKPTNMRAILHRLALRPVLVSGLIALSLLGPWFAYKTQNSSSDRLVKWHLAGVIAPDNRTTMQTIIDSYKNLSLHDWLTNRKINAKLVYTPTDKPDLSASLNTFGLNVAALKQSFGHLSKWYQVNDFYIASAALGTLNLGWIVVFMKRNRRRMSALQKRLAVACLVSLAIWVTVMFMPGSTVLHQGSYATMLALYGLLLTWLSRYRLLLGLFLLQFLLFNSLWVLGAFALFNQSLYRALPALSVGFLVAGIFLMLARLAAKMPSVYR